MKRVLLIAAMAIACMATNAQGRQIKQGMVLHYLVFVNDGEIQFDILSDSVSNNHVLLSWQMLSTGYAGTWRMFKPALDSAASGFWEAPQDGASLDFEANQLVLLLSKKSWREIHQTNMTTYDGTVFHRREKDDQLMIKGGFVKTIYLESEDASTRIWMLDDEYLPIIVKIEGNPYRVNVELQAVENRFAF